MATKTQAFYPSTVSASDSNILSITNEGNALGKGTSNTTYAEIGIRKGDNVVSYLYWPFSVGSIPADAVITSVACSVKTALNYVGSIGTATVQLYAGTTKKGSAKNILSSDVAVYTLSVGSWTRDELSSCRLYFYFSRNKNTTGSDRRLKFYGADLSATYTYQGEKFMLKLGGEYNDIARVFKKVSGIWVEQNDLANVIEDGVRYKNGGEYITPVKPATVTITGTGNATYCYATINGRKYNAPASNIEVNAGDVITFGVYNGGELKIDDETILKAGSGTTSTYDWMVPSGITSISIALRYYTVISPTYYGYVTVTTTGGGSSANLISFTIAGTSYQAEEGMTWGEWCNSGYNTANLYVISGGTYDGSIANAASTQTVTKGFTRTSSSDVIESGYTYSLTNYS